MEASFRDGPPLETTCKHSIILFEILRYICTGSRKPVQAKLNTNQIQQTNRKYKCIKVLLQVCGDPFTNTTLVASLVSS